MAECEKKMIILKPIWWMQAPRAMQLNMIPCVSRSPLFYISLNPRQVFDKFLTFYDRKQKFSDHSQPLA